MLSAIPRFASTPHGHGRPIIDDVKSVGCDQQRAGTPHHRHGVPALPLVTPCKFTNWPASAIAVGRFLYLPPMRNICRIRCLPELLKNAHERRL